MTEWRPLYARFDEDRAKQYDALHDGVPPWMAASLHDWVTSRIGAVSRRSRNEAPERLLEIERVLRITLNWRNGAATALTSLMDQLAAADELFLTAADHLLSKLDNPLQDRDAFDQLAVILREAGSVWEVRWHAQRRHPFLSRRVLPETEGVFNAAVAAGDRAAAHLRQAWERAFGRAANAADGAYRDSVRALEAALKPIVSPDNPTSTLGTIIKDIQAKPTKFAARLEPKGHDPVVIFASELQMLWTAQLDRHGTDDEAQPLNVSVEQAQDAAVRAAAILQIVRSGGFRLK